SPCNRIREPAEWLDARPERTKRKPRPTSRQGTHTQTTSDRSTLMPFDANPERLNGETSIGLHGRKNRWLLNGLKKATPRPPLVAASSSPWDAVEASKKRHTT